MCTAAFMVLMHVQIVVAVVSLAVIVLHKHLAIITGVLAAATVAVCAWPSVAARLRRRVPQHAAQRTESLESGPSWNAVDCA